jgi:hypothetical protein
MTLPSNSYFVRLRPDLSPQVASEFRAFAKNHRSANRQVTSDSFSRACGSDYWRDSGHWGDFARPLGDYDFEVFR